MFWPFLASYLVWLVLHRTATLGPLLQSRLGAALYAVAFHTTAHLLLTTQIAGAAVSALALVPLGVGLLWGSWLPFTVDEP